jgi:MarR family transcriptional regulator, temperature-dependent positive regulator of motility
MVALVQAMNTYELKASEIDFKALQVLEKSPQINQRELALQLGVSLGKANYCVKALLAKGQIKVKNFKNSQNKWAYAYVLTPAGMAARADLTVRFLQVKVAEYAMLKHDIEVLKALADQDKRNAHSRS